MRNLTRDELSVAKRDYTKGLTLPIVINEVKFAPTFSNCISFRYKNATGLIHPDNGYNGKTESGKDYYLLWTLSCNYSNDMKYNPSFSPDLESAAEAVINSWEQFTK